MSDQNDERNLRIVAEAKQLIDEIQGRFDREDEHYRQCGLDPEEVRHEIDRCLNSVASFAEEVVRDDMVAHRHEVDAEAARLGLTAPTSGIKAKKPRMMV